MSRAVEAFSLAEILADEMIERDWTSGDVALRMGHDRNVGLDQLAFELLLCVPDDCNLLLSDEQCADIARAFDISTDYIRKIHSAFYAAEPSRRAHFDCPDHLLGPARHPKESP